MQTNHVAALVRDLAAVAASLPDACTLHAPEEMPSEGTREQYVTFGDDRPDKRVPALLLMQAIADGPYQRALEKRGPGLHHLGCVCSDIDKEAIEGSASRLLLHPISLHTRKSGVVWMCRPGMPFLVELVESVEQSGIQQDVTLALPKSNSIPAMAHGLISNLTLTTNDEPTITMSAGGITVSIDPSMS